MSHPPQGPALVTGVAGQDGVHLARLLIDSGVPVVGTVPPGSADATAMAPYLHGVTVVEHDVRDGDGFRALLAERRPTEVYNLAGLTSVGASWDQPELTDEVNGAAVERIVAALVEHRDRTGDDVRLFQASSAEEFGAAADSPYARSKARARAAVARAREADGLFACVATLHNHESPLRPARFVTRKITRAAAEIALGRRERVTLGNLTVTRDWGWAGDHVRAMRLLLSLREPLDVVVGTGVPHTLEDLLVTAFAAVGIDDPWPYVEQDPALLRPRDSDALGADPGPAAAALGWQPTRSFEETIEHMVRIDVRRLETGVDEALEYLTP